MNFEQNARLFGGPPPPPPRASKPGLSVRPGVRAPLRELSTNSNNRQKSLMNEGPVKTRAFTIYEDQPSTSNDENKPPPPLPTFGGLNKVWTSRGGSSSTTSSWPPPIPSSSSRLGFVIHQDDVDFSPKEPQAASSPANLPGHSWGAVGDHLRGNSHYESSEEDVENLPPIIPSQTTTSSSSSTFSLCYSQGSSLSQFRQNNDSISSVTTNSTDEACDDEDEDDDEEEEEDNSCHVLDECTEAENFQVMSLDNSLNTKLANSVVVEVDEYTLDILKHMMQREMNFAPKWNYMTKQPDITFTMRSILIDWLVEVGEEYRLHTETLFLAVNFIDRFLSFMSVQRAKLQLVGTACMFIAAKYEEIYPPEVTEFCYITDDTYTKRQVLRMEHLVLGVLNFECAVPTSHFFVNQIAQLAGCAEEALSLAQYLTELTLLDAEAFLPFAPSLVASSAVALARHTLGLAAWEDAMVEKTGYSVDNFKECIVRLHSTFTRAPDLPQQAIREKYKTEKYHCVSEVKPTPVF